MASPAIGEITLVLHRLSAGEPEQSRLADLVFTDLRRIASQIMGSESGDNLIQPTVIASDAYMRLVEQGCRNWHNRAHFYAAAAQAMRRIIVDYVRRRRSLKRGGTSKRVDPTEIANFQHDSPEEILALDEALSRLEEIDQRQSKIVELRYFTGLTEEETADILGIGLRTVKREWAVARAWLYAELTRPAVSPLRRAI